VREQLGAIVARTAADELIVAGAIHARGARKRSYELLAALAAPVALAPLPGPGQGAATVRGDQPLGNPASGVMP
jgi:hypothetical protein